MKAVDAMSWPCASNFRALNSLEKPRGGVNHLTHHPHLSMVETSGAESCVVNSFTAKWVQANPSDLKIARTPLINRSGVGRSMG